MHLSRYATIEEIAFFHVVKLCQSVKLPTFKAFRVGGLRFVRVGRLQMSFCIVRKGK